MNMTIDLTQLVLALLGVLGTILTGVVIPYIKERYNAEQLEKARTWAKIAVNAAEQLMKSGKIQPEERKEYAMGVLQSKGIKLDLNQLDDMVEAFVLELPKKTTSKSTTKSTATKSTATKNTESK